MRCARSPPDVKRGVAGSGAGQRVALVQKTVPEPLGAFFGEVEEVHDWNHVRTTEQPQHKLVVDHSIHLAPRLRVRSDYVAVYRVDRYCETALRIDRPVGKLKIGDIVFAVANVVLRRERRTVDASEMPVDVLRELVVDAKEQPVVGKVFGKSVEIHGISVV